MAVKTTHTIPSPHEVTVECGDKHMSKACDMLNKCQERNNLGKGTRSCVHQCAWISGWGGLGAGLKFSTVRKGKPQQEGDI